MKTLIALAILSLTVSFSAFAQETCHEGFSCEQSKGQNILRRTNLIQDEGLSICQTVTISNFGADKASCEAYAAQSNDPAVQRFQCISDRLQAINSDIYYNLDQSAIEKMLKNPEQFGHLDAVRAAELCDKELK